MYKPIRDKWNLPFPVSTARRLDTHWFPPVISANRRVPSYLLSVLACAHDWTRITATISYTCPRWAGRGASKLCRCITIWKRYYRACDKIFSDVFCNVKRCSAPQIFSLNKITVCSQVYPRNKHAVSRNLTYQKCSSLLISLWTIQFSHTY
jgi:hypothetical protein